MAVLTRRATADDLARLGELHSAVWSELYTGVLDPATLASLDSATMTGLWEKFISRGDDYVQHVAELGGEIVGFVGTGPGRDPGYELGRELFFIYVDPSARRSGVGRALLRKADADYLWIAEANRATQAFYRALKFFPDSVAREGSLFGTPLQEIRMAR